MYEWRTAEGTPTGMTQGSAGYVHLEGIDQPIGLIRREGTRVVNYTWRGLGESSVFTNGASGDCAIFVSGCTAVQWPGKTQAGVYFTPNLLASGPSGPYTWFGTLAENGGGSTGMLFRRNRYFDPVSGRFTQQDPIGVAGGMNLYGFADGDPLNFSDPFGLCPWCRILERVGTAASAVGRFGQQIASVVRGIASSPATRQAAEAVDDLAERVAARSAGAWEIAVTGGRHAGLLRTYSSRSISEIQAGITSLEARVAEHLVNIRAPTSAIPNWTQLDPRAQQGVLKFWEKEAVNYSQQAEVLRGMLRP